MTRWTAHQVTEVAPDASSLSAARKLAVPGPWRETGCNDVLVWGQCQGSGKTPYQVSVDLVGPAYRCSCPSRKFPCKHALALLLLWSEGAMSESGTVAAFAEDWAASRAERSAATPGPVGARAPDPAAQARRLDQRLTRMDAGVEDFRLWMTDLVRGGLATTRTQPYAFWDNTAARLVDAQLPALADRVREAGSQVHAREQWAPHLLAELGRWWTITCAWQAREQLDADELAEVRVAVGWAQSSEEVREGDARPGPWTVLGAHRSDDGRLQQQRTWLAHDDGEVVEVLDFAGYGQALAVPQLGGARLDVELSRYPGTAPRRALFRDPAGGRGVGDRTAGSRRPRRGARRGRRRPRTYAVARAAPGTAGGRTPRRRGRPVARQRRRGLGAAGPRVAGVDTPRPQRRGAGRRLRRARVGGLPSAHSLVGRRGGGVDRGLSLLADGELDATWAEALESVSAPDHVAGGVAGRATRILLDAGRIDSDTTAHRMGRRLSLAASAPQAAAWLGGFLAGDADGLTGSDGGSVGLGPEDVRRDEALAALYDSRRTGGLGGSAPRVSRWLGDIRTYFPSSVVQVMQGDAMERLGLRQMLLEPEMMRSVQPDVGLVSTLIGLGRVIPEHSRETARAVVRQVTDELEERLRQRTVQAVSGALDRSARTRRPRMKDVDWRRTVAANLKHYLPEHRTVVPERLVGYARRSTQVEREIILCIDQSGSMAESIVYSSVFGAVLASVRSVSTRLVVFDTEVVDLTDEIDDPVDVLLGVQLGGGTDINRALAYCQGKIAQPADTVLVLISDLYEGGIAEEMISRARSVVGSGATMIALLALSDSGQPSFDTDHAAALAEIGVPSFACTPDLFPDLMAAAIERRDIGEWAAANDIVTTHETTPPP